LHEEHARHGSKLLDINMGDTLCTMGCVSPADSRKNVTVSRKNSACAPALMHSRSSTQSTQFVQASRQLCTNLVSQDHTKGAVRRLAHGFSHAHSSLFRTQPVHAAAPDADRGRAPLATVIFAVCANNGLQHPREAHLEADVHDECLDEQHEGEDAPQCQHHLHALRGEGPQRASLPPERPHLWVPPSTAHQVRLTRSSQLSCLICMAPGKRQLGLDRATNKQPERHHEPPHCRLHTGERRACLRQRAVDAEPQPECTVGAERDAGKHVVPPDLPLQRRTSTFDVCTAKPPARAELNSAQLVDTLSSISNALDWGVR